MLKCCALALAPRLGISPRCLHLRGGGGTKRALREVWAALPANRFVLKTDVQGSYATMEHHRLLDRLARVVTDRRLLNLLAQYCVRSSERGGLFWDYRRGVDGRRV